MKSNPNRKKRWEDAKKMEKNKNPEARRRARIMLLQQVDYELYNSILPEDRDELRIMEGVLLAVGPQTFGKRNVLERNILKAPQTKEKLTDEQRERLKRLEENLSAGGLTRLFNCTSTLRMLKKLLRSADLGALLEGGGELPQKSCFLPGGIIDSVREALEQYELMLEKAKEKPEEEEELVEVKTALTDLHTEMIDELGAGPRAGGKARQVQADRREVLESLSSLTTEQQEEYDELSKILDAGGKAVREIAMDREDHYIYGRGSDKAQVNIRSPLGYLMHFGTYDFKTEEDKINCRKIRDMCAWS